MTFRGWKAEALEFFDGLEEENTKAFWERNKHTYETLVRSPMEELLAELKKDWGEGRIFRRTARAVQQGQVAVQDEHRRMVGDGYVSFRARPGRGRRHVGDGSGPAGAIPAAVDETRRAKLARVVGDIREREPKRPATAC